MIRNVAFFSECGSRDINQDAIYASVIKDKGIFVVADGMGGHSGGELASRAVVSGIRDWWEDSSHLCVREGIDRAAEQCRDILLHINGEVYSYFDAQGHVGGSTVAVLILWEDQYVTLSAGDSRIYRARERRLEQLTIDDVWENLPEVKYGMSRKIAVLDSRCGKLTQALGSAERLIISRGGGILSPQESFLLCSDGVHRYCDHEVLKRIMCREMAIKDVERRKEMIRKCVLKNGAADNYSAILCRAGCKQSKFGIF